MGHRVVRSKLKITLCICTVGLCISLVGLDNYMQYTSNYFEGYIQELRYTKPLLEDDAIHKLVRDTSDNFNRTTPVNGVCKDYIQSAIMQRPVLNDILGHSSHSPANSSITMVTQMTWDRQHNFFLMLQHWNGPVSVCIYGDVRIVNDVIRNITNHLSLYDGQTKRQVLVHFVHQIGLYYPINYLRNVALDAATTRYVLLNDVDFIPMPGSHDKILAWMVPGLKLVLVVPAMEEISEGAIHGVIPANKTLLLDSWISESVQGFHQTFYAPGHSPTDYNKWKSGSTTQPYQISYRPDFEPYVVGEKSLMPQYYTGFVDRGFDKISHSMELNALGFEFWVCPDVFLLHMWHPLLKNNQTLMRCIHDAMNNLKLHLQDVEKHRALNI